MLSVDEARARLIKNISIVNIETIETVDSLGRILAESVKANIDSPPFDNSSMDGFALISADINNADKTNPAELKVVGDIPAGKVSKIAVKPGEAMRIMTGAPMPNGADSVIPVEKTNVNYHDINEAVPENVLIYSSVDQGGYVRKKGEDFSYHQVLIKPNTQLRAQEIGLMATLGKTSVNVFRRPKIGLFSSGDELLNIEEEMAPGKIRNSNSYTLTALLDDCGVEVVNLGIAKDTEKDVRRTLDMAVTAKVDLIISSAGVSVGAYDYVRVILENEGKLDFWKVNMRPGKPLAFGHYGDIPFVGLPGNPVSSFIGFEVFLRPLIYYLSGIESWKRQITRVSLAEKIISDGRESYLRGIYKPQENLGEVSLTGHQGSGNLYSLVLSQGLIVIPAGIKELSAGAEVDFWPFVGGLL